MRTEIARHDTDVRAKQMKNRKRSALLRKVRMRDYAKDGKISRRLETNDICFLGMVFTWFRLVYPSPPPLLSVWDPKISRGVVFLCAPRLPVSSKMAHSINRLPARQEKTAQ